MPDRANWGGKAGRAAPPAGPAGHGTGNGTGNGTGSGTGNGTVTLPSSGSARIGSPSATAPPHLHLSGSLQLWDRHTCVPWVTRAMVAPCLCPLGSLTSWCHHTSVPVRSLRPGCHRSCIPRGHHPLVTTAATLTAPCHPSAVLAACHVPIPRVPRAWQRWPGRVTPPRHSNATLAHSDTAQHVTPAVPGAPAAPRAEGLARVTSTGLIGCPPSGRD